MTPRVAVAIVHAAHIPERVKLYERLLEQLTPFASSSHYIHTESTRGRWFVWHPLILDWFVEQSWGRTHCLTIQDDVTVDPQHFWIWLEALVAGRPDEVICLHNGHPGARTVFVEGKPGYHTFDGMVGQGHVEPIEVVRDFRTWRLEEVRPEMLRQITEDMLFGLYCMSRRRPIFHPVPSLIDHDLEITSTNEGFDEHLYRRPQVTWKELERLDAYGEGRLAREAFAKNPAWWAQDVEHLGRFYDDAHQLLPLVLRDKHLGAELALEYEAIETPARHRRFFMRARATR